LWLQAIVARLAPINAELQRFKTPEGAAYVDQVLAEGAAAAAVRAAETMAAVRAHVGLA
jgi:hypothetical protein